MTRFFSQGLQTYCRLLQVTRPYWGFFVLGVLGTIAVSGIDAGFTWLIRPIINKGFIDRDVAFIHLLPLLVITIFLFRGVSGFLSTYFISRVARNVVRDLRRALFGHFLKLPIEFFDRHAASRLISTIIYNVEQVAEAASSTCLVALQECSLIIGLIVVMFLMNWQLTLFFVAVTPFMTAVIRKNSTRLRKLSTSVQQSMGDITQIAAEAIEANKIIRLHDSQRYELKKFSKATQTNQQRELKMVVTNSMGGAILQFFISIVIAMILFFATRRGLNVTAGSFASIVSAMVMLLRPARRLNMVNTNLQKGIASADGLFKFLDEPCEQDVGKKFLKKAFGQIEYRQVHFSYTDATHFQLKGINFAISPGKKVAIVGKSGSGKSTVLQLLPRFYPLLSGSIHIDGVSIHEFPLSLLRKQIALVSQHMVLFDDTIANNIAYGQEIVDLKKVAEVAEMAQAMEFIMQLPNGLNTRIGEKGEKLSVGQRQRLMIARALLKDAPILILDEATSALDAPAERLIQNALERLQKNRTTLMVTHRLSTVENADLILVLEQGCVVEQGTHEQLLKLGKHYAALYHSHVSVTTEAL